MSEQQVTPAQDAPCSDCGMDSPCGEKCPNYQEQEVPANDREIRTGAHVLQMARSLGWPDDGEGALEFMLRRAREVAFEDCGRAASDCRSPAVDDSAVFNKRLSEASVEIKALEKELSQARDLVEELTTYLDSPPAQAAAQQAILKHPHWSVHGPAAAYGFAGAALKAVRASIPSTERQDG